MDSKKVVSPKAKAKAAADEPPNIGTQFYAHDFEEHERPALLAGRQWVPHSTSADVIVVRDLSLVQEARDGTDVRLPQPLLNAMLLGKRVATPSLCNASAPGGGTSIVFQPLLRHKFYVFFYAALHDQA